MSSLKVKITTHKTALTGSLLLIALILAVVGYRRTQAVANARDRSQPLNASIEIYPNQAEQVVNKAVPFVSAVVYGSPSLDVNQIDPASIKLSGASLMRRGNGKLRMKISDINGDGISDMRFAVWSDKMELSEGAHVASLGAKTFDGREITGQHKVDVVNRPLHTESILNSQQGKTPSRGKVPPVSPLSGSTFTNAAAIAINDANPNAAATPYPSQITVAGLPFPGIAAPAYKFTVKIFNFRHHFPEDVDMMLVGPGVGSPRLIFWSDVGGTTSNCGNVGGNCDAVTPGPFLIINDASPALLPVGSALPAAATCTAATVETATACHFKPTDNGTGENFSAAGTPPPPCSGVGGCDAAAAAPAGANTLNGTFGAITLNPNGVWSLYIMDDTFGDGLGQVANGWALTIVPQPAAFPTSAPANISGTINTPDGQPLAGVALDLKGSSSARTITDSNGHYSFDSLPSGDFYTVTPSRANYSFSPAERSFTLNADKTDAGFAAEETQSVANPLDTDLFFVRQQYLDFLSREPDMGGLGYWTEQMSQCGADTACINSRRIDISAAFFMEAEFQQTGSFVYGLYRGSLGRNPLFAEFMPDRNRISVGDGLEQSKQALADEWVTRTEFRNAYPDSMSNSEFVNRLFDTAGLTGYSSERQGYINALNSGGTRSQVLRGVIEGSAFRQKEYNRAFVLTEYFSYLRRDPDQAGLDFWVNVLDTREVGNYRGMVCSFITSAEYQKRFSAVVTHSNNECGQ